MSSSAVDRKYPIANKNETLDRTTTKEAEAAEDKPDKKYDSLDGGWGWMIVLGSSFCHFFLIGINRSMGIVFVLLRERFDVSATQSSLAASIFVSVRALGGPIASKMSDRFGCRAVVMIGGLLLCLGLVLSAVATNIIHVYLAFGAVAGVGGFMVFSPSYVAVSEWFDKKKGKAMSFSTLGTGFGSICMAPVVMALIHGYNYFGTMLILGALMLNNCVGGALYRSPRLQRRQTMKEVVVVSVVSELKKKADDETASNVSTQQQQDKSTDIPAVRFIDKSTTHAEQAAPETDYTESSHAEPTTNDATSEALRDDGREDIVPNDGHRQYEKIEFDSSAAPSKDELICEPLNVQSLAVSAAASALSTAPLDEKELQKVVAVNTDRQSGLNSHSVDPQSGVQKPAEKSAGRRSKLLPRVSIRSSLWTNFPFIIYCFLIAAVQGCIQSVLIFLPARGRELGASPEASALLLTLFGAFDMAGRFVFGFVFDFRWFRSRRTDLYTVVALAFSIFSAILGAADSYVALAAVTCLVALFEGGAHSQRATNVTELVEPSQMSIGVGLVILFQGLGNFYGPFVGGILRDRTGSYSSCFVFGGMSLLIACVLTAIENFVRQQRKNIRAAQDKQLQ